MTEKNFINKKEVFLTIIFGEFKFNQISTFLKSNSTVIHAIHEFTAYELVKNKIFPAPMFSEKNDGCLDLEMFDYCDELFARDIVGIEKDDPLLASVKFILFYEYINIVKVKLYLEQNLDKNIILVTSGRLLRWLNEMDESLISANVQVITLNEVNMITAISNSYLNSFNGRYNSLRYMVGLPVKLLLDFRGNRRSVIQNSTVLCSNSVISEKMAKLICGSGTSCKRVSDTVKPHMILGNIFLQFKHRSMVALDLKLPRNFGVFFMFYAIVMRAYSYAVQNFLSENHSKIAHLVQHTDVSPLTAIWATICKKRNVSTIVGQHGLIVEPFGISRILSDVGYLTHDKTFSIYQQMNPHKKIYKINDYLIDESVNAGDWLKGGGKKSKNIVVFTCGYSGNSFYSCFSLNFRLIRAVLDSLHLLSWRPNVVVKVHPSEKARLYKNIFPDLTVTSKFTYEQYLDCRLAFVSPSTISLKLAKLGVPFFDASALWRGKLEEELKVEVLNYFENQISRGSA